MITEHFYYTQLNLTDGTPIMLDSYGKDGSDAMKHFRAMQDRGILKDSFRELENIPISEFDGLSLVRVTTKYGRQIKQECISRKAL